MRSDNVKRLLCLYNDNIQAIDDYVETLEHFKNKCLNYYELSDLHKKELSRKPQKLIEKQLQDRQLYMDMLQAMINLLPDPDQRKLMELHYISNWPLSDCSPYIHYARTQTYKMHNRCIKIIADKMENITDDFDNFAIYDISHLLCNQLSK